MTTRANETNYKIEYTTLAGETYYSPVKNYTREFAQKMVRFHRLNGMFEQGRRARLINVQVVVS